MEIISKFWFGVFMPCKISHLPFVSSTQAKTVIAITLYLHDFLTLALRYQ